MKMSEINCCNLKICRGNECRVRGNTAGENWRKDGEKNMEKIENSLEQIEILQNGF